jgi:outer membrane murein-binding lipoprotein Lpp
VSAIGKTTEKKGQRKIISRTMVIALGLICIILAAGIVGAIAFYMPMVSNLEFQIAEKNSTISSLNSQVSSLNSQILSLQADIEQINSTIEDYKDAQEDAQEAFNLQAEYYNSLLALNESGYLLSPRSFTQAANTSDVVSNEDIGYAGYVSVAVESSSNTTYVQLVYSSHGVNFNQNVTVGTGGTAVFPVLPGDITVVIGNTEAVDDVTGTVTAIYRY